ncbi:MAG: hypothetical protein L0H41_15425 [Microlunatus sp.]|nr:hypothetical protein [Microlunatus sp.]MDN5771770.1 hypothetical protein [Microlunatus sp.]
MSDLTLAEVMEQHPELTSFGIGVFDQRRKPRGVREAEMAQERTDLIEGEANVHKIVAWLRDNDLKPIQTPSRNSYALKHLVEKRIGYVTNGEFIAAALIVGYPYRYRTPNVLFGISARDLRRVSGSHG